MDDSKDTMTVTLISQDNKLQHTKLIYLSSSQVPDLWHLEAADFVAVALQHLPVLVSDAFSPFFRAMPNVCLENLF